MRLFFNVDRSPFQGAGARNVAILVGAVRVAIVAAVLMASRAAQAQNVVAGLKFETNASMGMFIVPSSGKGVSSAVSSFTIDGTTSAMYTVNGAQANFAEKIALDKMLPLVQNLPLPLVGGGPNDRRNQLMKSVNENLVSGAAQFVRANKGVNTAISTTSTSFDNGKPVLSVSGNQAYTTLPDATNVVRLSATQTGDAPKGGKFDALTLVINKDPFAVDWGSSAHEWTISLGEVSLFAQAEPNGQAASIGILQGGYVNGTDDVTTPDSLATSLFNLSMGVTSFDGSSPSADLTFSFLGDPGMISDNHGHMGLANVLAAMSSQFSILRTDGNGASYFGFDPDYQLTMTVPGIDPQTVLFLDQVGATAQAVPEAGSLTLAALGIAGSWCLVRRARQKR